MVSNSKAQKDIGLEGRIVLLYFASWLILKVGKPLQAELSCSHVWQSLYRHCGLGWQQDPDSNASLTAVPATFQEQPSESTGLFLVLSLVFMQKGFFFDWISGLAVVPAVTFRATKPQPPTLTGFHKCNKTKFIFLSF